MTDCAACDGNGHFMFCNLHWRCSRRHENTLNLTVKEDN